MRPDILRHFQRANCGNVAIMFAASIFVMIGVGGLALDARRAGTAKAELQASLDAATLAAARRQSNNEPNAISAIEKFIGANFRERYPGMPVEVTATINNEGLVESVARAKVKTTLMQLLGFRDVTVEARSAAQFGAGVAEVVLALDNTFSMSGTKIDALKDGAKDLIDIIFEPADAEQTVRMGIVPFGQYVNVGFGNRDEPWISVEPDSSTTANQCWDTYPNATSSNCRDESYTYYEDGIARTGTHTVCDWDYGSAVQQCGPVTTTKEWFGCVGSRPHPLDTGISSDFSTPVPGVMHVNPGPWATCPRPLQRLSNDPALLKSVIEDMQVVDVSMGTYIQSGLIWAWRLMSPDAPFADGASRTARPDLKRFLVLMTDGANTRAPTYPYHDWDVTNASAPANALTAETCASIKAEGTMIYAIAFDVNDPTIQNLLRDCATAPPYYYVAEDSQALRDAFKSIANAVVAIRLTQ